MTDMTEDRVREIVRDELAKANDEAAVVSNASLAVYSADVRMQLDKLMDDQHMPDDMREALTAYAEKLLP